MAAALAVLGAIAAADAICGLRLGWWSRGQDHGQAAALLETVDLKDSTLAKKFRQVLSVSLPERHSSHLDAATADCSGPPVFEERAVGPIRLPGRS